MTDWKFMTEEEPQGCWFISSFVRPREEVLNQPSRMTLQQAWNMFFPKSADNSEICTLPPLPDDVDNA